MWRWCGWLWDDDAAVVMCQSSVYIVQKHLKEWLHCRDNYVKFRKKNYTKKFSHWAGKNRDNSYDGEEANYFRMKKRKIKFSLKSKQFERYREWKSLWLKRK